MRLAGFGLRAKATGVMLPSRQRPKTLALPTMGALPGYASCGVASLAPGGRRGMLKGLAIHSPEVRIANAGAKLKKCRPIPAIGMQPKPTFDWRESNGRFDPNRTSQPSVLDSPRTRDRFVLN
jgi:hypothetical protein